MAKTETEGGYFGWVIVLAAFALNVLGFGSVALVSVLIKPLAQEFGWQRGEVAAAYTIASVAIAVGGISFGRISDRYSARIISALGACTIAACVTTLSQISQLWQLYGIYAVLGALGFGALYIPLIGVVTNWFTTNRGIAVGIAMAGASIGTGMVPFVASIIIVESGWRDALLCLGVGYFVIAAPMVLLLRNPPKVADSGAGSTGAPLPEETMPIQPRSAIAWICVAIVFSCTGMGISSVHVPALVSDLGQELENATSVLTVIMVSGAVGRLVLGRVADRIGPLNTYLLASLGQTTFVFWFTQASSLTVLYPLAIAYGLFNGGAAMCAYLTVRSLVPSRIAGTAIGFVSGVGWIGMGLGGYLGGVTFDWSGRYILAFALAVCVGLTNLAVLLSLYVRLRRSRRLPIDLGPAKGV